MVHDFGRVLNPMLLEGQMQGGVVQGIGQAAFERVVHDADSGQVHHRLVHGLSGSPRLRPAIASTLVLPPDSLAPSNPLGVKGCGEAGAAGACPAVMNALVDALWEREGVRKLDMPATPAAHLGGVDSISKPASRLHRSNPKRSTTRTAAWTSDEPA